MATKTTPGAISNKCPTWWAPVSSALGPTWGANRANVRTAWMVGIAAYAPLEPFLIALLAVIDFAQSCDPQKVAQLAACDQRVKFALLASISSVAAPIVVVMAPPFATIAVGYAAACWLAVLLFRWLCNGTPPKASELAQIPGKAMQVAAGVAAMGKGDAQSKQGTIDVAAFFVSLQQHFNRIPSKGEVQAMANTWGIGPKPGLATAGAPSTPIGTIGMTMASQPTSLAIAISGNFQSGVNPSAAMTSPAAPTVRGTATTTGIPGAPTKKPAKGAGTMGGGTIDGGTSKQKASGLGGLVIGGAIAAAVAYVTSTGKKKKRKG